MNWSNCLSSCEGGGNFVQKCKDDVLYSLLSSSIFLQQMTCVAIAAFVRVRNQNLRQM
jgi:hypothetical protein